MIPATWLHSLRLENRNFPEFIQSGDDLSGIPHSSVIRQSFDELNIAAIHCISGVPSIAFIAQEIFDQDEVDYVHKALWNQGLATLLLVISGDILRAYSLSQLPEINSEQTDKLVQVFNLTNDALELKDLVLGVESGRFIADNEDKFDSKYRVDQVLLTNLEATVKRLIDNNIKLESAQALLMQIMFISYLEDKEIINSEYFNKATGNTKIDSLKTLLSDGRINKFAELFKLLKKHFNGDLFVAPCSFDKNEAVENLGSEHIEILSGFRAGNIDLSSGQYQFWPYDFRFIPIELISAVYDRFLGFDPTSKRESGAYYTPMFLADLVVEQAWSELNDKQKISGKYVDPSCGSGIFLVRLFEKMIAEWKIKHQDQHPTWPALLAMLRRLHGFDIKKESIRVAAFSLYIALLENSRPAEILALMKKGRLLPKLCGETLLVTDFFVVSNENYQYDLIIGNPPWVSRRGEQKTAEKWCKENNYKMPAKEISWGFAWKALSHSKKDCVIALLLKATSFLTSQSTTIVKARNEWWKTIQLIRAVNFADTRFQLFEGGDAPAALMIYKHKISEGSDYDFDYWVPKADLNLKTKRMMTLSSVDQARLSIERVIHDSLLLKRRMWMNTPDAKLFQYLNQFPKLSEKVITYQDSRKKENKLSCNWIIGQGFKRAQDNKINDDNYSVVRSNVITEVPFLDMKMFCPIVLPKIKSSGWPTNIVHRIGFEQGFKAPHILIPQGIEREQGRLRASYSEQELSFLSSLQSIHIHDGETQTAKFLTVLLNSSLVAWYLFHNSSISGMERDKVPQQEVLEIPFPSIERLSETKNAKLAFKDAVKLVDGLMKKKDDLFQEEVTGYLSKIDKIVYRYFDLKETDILLIEDTLNHIIPSMQPRARSKTVPSLWKDTSESDWNEYSTHLASALTNWLEEPYRAICEIVGASSDLVVVGIHLTDDQKKSNFSCSREDALDNILPKIWDSLPQNLPGNFQLIPDLRIFIDDVLYLVKPRKRRFWLGSTALADADAIAADLLSQTR
ncbi:MAG: N-6 DNA methylase [Zetaproteobacteria bacterium]|nr:MAG: N-6 DNA methylase [Zetaproteobacteria bacterium]